MTNYPYILFNQSPEQLRQIGARGGRAYGRNQRTRRAATATVPETVELRVAPRESTAEAIAALDAQFPWLRGAERRRAALHGRSPVAPAPTRVDRVSGPSG